MRLIQLLTIFAAMTVPRVVKVHSQELDGKQPPYLMQARDRLESSRNKLHVELAIMRHNLARVQYIAGTATVDDAIQTAETALRKGLAVGNKDCGLKYDDRISELRSIASQKLTLGTGTQGDVDAVADASIDSILKRHLLTPSVSK